MPVMPCVPLLILSFKLLDTKFNIGYTISAKMLCTGGRGQDSNFSVLKVLVFGKAFGLFKGTVS
jgi:hypothetical protein